MTSQADFAGYAALADASLYPTPSRGFKSRMIGLFSLTGLVAVLAIIYLILLGIENKRRERKLWVFKLVSRPSGKYIATNQAIWTGILSFFSALVILGHLQDEYRIYLLHASQAATPSWRAWSWFPIVANGWLMSWASLQSFLLTPDQHNKTFLSANWANGLFLGGAAGITVALFISASFVSATGLNMWLQFCYLKSILITLSLQAEPDFSTIALLSNQYAMFNDSVDDYKKCALTLGILLAFTPFMTLFINMGALGLARVLRKQINQSLATLQKSSQTSQQENKPDVSNENSRTKFAIYHVKHDQTSTIPSRRTIRHLASLQNQGFEGEQAKKIMLLQRAETDLNVLGSFIFSLSLIFIGITLWVLSSISNGVLFSKLPWAGLEAALFSIEWIYAIVLSAVLMFLIYNAITHLGRPKTSISTSESVSQVYFNASESIASFGAMFRKNTAGGAGSTPFGSKPSTFANSTFPTLKVAALRSAHLGMETKRFSTVEEQEEDEKGEMEKEKDLENLSSHEV